MKRTRSYRREVRRRKIARKKRVSKAVYGMDWFRTDGKYSKGHIGCGCRMCKYSRHYKIPLLYEVKDREYVKSCMQELEE